MRDYGKVHSSFWSSTTTRSLSEDARMLALYLITSPHSTIAGVFRLPDGYVCEDMQWSSERVSKGFAELFRKGFANRCETTKWVWVAKHFDWNRPENPNQRKAAAKVALSIPGECAWKPYFMRDWADFLGLEWSEKDNPSGTLTEPFPNQKQEQEQEQEQEQKKREKRPRSPTGARLPPDWELPAEWKAWAMKERPELDSTLEGEKFRDYWHSQPGAKGRKTDWQATWRNWIRNAHVPFNRGNGRNTSTGYVPIAGEV